MTHGGMFSYRVQRLIKCWINDTVNKKFNCLGADILKLLFARPRYCVVFIILLIVFLLIAFNMLMLTLLFALLIYIIVF
jgi:hypothetical protein